uniref:flagellar motor protein MotB n=1 Tax=Armatimonas sp. TaxID=1872638 RepID=UPI00286A1853
MADNQVIIVKKKAAHGHAHHGGSWKVAYADFVTAMMAFFMVMWIMGLSEDNKNIIQGYFNDPMGFNKSVPRSSSIIDLKMK